MDKKFKSMEEITKEDYMKFIKDLGMQKANHNSKYTKRYCLYLCPSCGKEVAHQRGVPCNQIKCPSCGALMSRQM